jgi:hypothetical protein
MGGSSVLTRAVVSASRKLFDFVDGVTAAPTVEAARPMAKS